MDNFFKYSFCYVSISNRFDIESFIIEHFRFSILLLDRKNKGQRDSGQEGCMTEGMQDRRDSGQEGCKTEGMQDRRDSGQEGCMTGEIQDRRDAG